MTEVLSERRVWMASLSLFVAAFVLLLLFMYLQIGNYDEGIDLTGGQLVASGAVPHRDFYAIFGPGQFYVLAGLFHLFGTSFLVARVYDIAVRAAIVASVFWILARRCHPLTSVGTAILCGLWMWGFGYNLYPIIPVLLLSLWGTCVLLPVDGRPAGPRRLIIAGALTGVSALFRYDIGFLILIAHLTALGLLVPRNGRSPWRVASDFLREVGLYGAGTATTFLPPAIILLCLGAGPGFIADMVQVSTFHPSMTLPFPGLSTLIEYPWEVAVYLPFVAVAFATIVTARASWAPKFETVLSASDRRFLLVLGLLIAALLLKGTLRPTVSSMMLAIIPSTFLFGFLAERTCALSPPWQGSLGLAVLLTVIPPIKEAIPLGVLLAREPANAFLGYALGLDQVGPDGLATARLPNVAGARMGVADLCAAQLVTSLSRPGERILVATGRHDKVLYNNLALYFVTGRAPGTHWYHYESGLQTRNDIQRRIIGEIEKTGVRWVIRDSSDDDGAEPNASAISSGVKTLDLYLLQRYRPVTGFGAISIWLRNTEIVSIPPPSGTCRNLQLKNRSGSRSIRSIRPRNQNRGGPPSLIIVAAA